MQCIRIAPPPPHSHPHLLWEGERHPQDCTLFQQRVLPYLSRALSMSRLYPGVRTYFSEKPPSSVTDISMPFRESDEMRCACPLITIRGPDTSMTRGATSIVGP